MSELYGRKGEESREQSVVRDSLSPKIKQSEVQTDDYDAVNDFDEEESLFKTKKASKAKSSKKKSLGDLLVQGGDDEEEEEAPEESPIVKDSVVLHVDLDSDAEDQNGGESSDEAYLKTGDEVGDESVLEIASKDVYANSGSEEEEEVVWDLKKFLDNVANSDDDDDEEDDDFIFKGVPSDVSDGEFSDDEEEDFGFLRNVAPIRGIYLALPSDDDENEEDDEDYDAEDCENESVSSDDFFDDGLDGPEEFNVKEKTILDEDSDDQSVDFDDDSDGDNDTLPSETCTCSTNLLKLYGTELNDDQESFSESEEFIDEDGADSCVCFTTKKRTIDEVLFDLSEGIDLLEPEATAPLVKRPRLEETHTLKRTLVTGGVGAVIGGVATFLGLAYSGSGSN